MFFELEHKSKNLQYKGPMKSLTRKVDQILKTNVDIMNFKVSPFPVLGLRSAIMLRMSVFNLDIFLQISLTTEIWCHFVTKGAELLMKQKPSMFSGPFSFTGFRGLLLFIFVTAK